MICKNMTTVHKKLFACQKPEKTQNFTYMINI